MLHYVSVLLAYLLYTALYSVGIMATASLTHEIPNKDI